MYDVTGVKRRMVVNDSSISLETNTDYLNAVVYEDGVIDYLVMDEGLVKNESGEYRYHYYLQDHLGNTRAVFKNDGGNVATLIQANSYYPFGLEMPELSYVSGSGETKYKYNGKEMQDAFSLNWIDYGARFYDPQIGRWHVVDRFAEKYPNLSPYQYVDNNPIKTIDINGDSLMVITLKGLDANNPQIKQREYYVDSEIGYQMKAFAESAMEKFSNLSVNNVYRSFSSSEINTGNTKAKGLSRHQGGFAIDFNGVKNLSKSQLEDLNELAKQHGLAPLVNQTNDLPHFDSDPTKYGYKNLKEAVDENKSHYDSIKQGKAEPVKFDQKKYEEYKNKNAN